MTRDVSVVNMGGTLCTIAVDSTLTVEGAKAAIEAAASIPASEQRLLADTCELYRDDQIVLNALAAASADLLSLVRRQREQAKWLEQVKQDGMLLKCAPAAIQADREIVLAAVRQGGLALQYAAPELRADREIVLASVQQWGNALRYATGGLDMDVEVVSAAVRKDGFALRHASEELRALRQVVMIAVQNDGFALPFAAEELRMDRHLLAIAQQRRDLHGRGHCLDGQRA
mmetsp:Transcript_112242/g.177482  ORF Transcript_112242/g.177482 Transcript_112242/m.177482 type:complete len:230 (+) Transcript_112242:81-770(+)